MAPPGCSPAAPLGERPGGGPPRLRHQPRRPLGARGFPHTPLRPEDPAAEPPRRGGDAPRPPTRLAPPGARAPPAPKAAAREPPDAACFPSLWGAQGGNRSPEAGTLPARKAPPPGGGRAGGAASPGPKGAPPARPPPISTWAPTGPPRRAAAARRRSSEGGEGRASGGPPAPPLPHPGVFLARNRGRPGPRETGAAPRGAAPHAPARRPGVRGAPGRWAEAGGPPAPAPPGGEGPTDRERGGGGGGHDDRRRRESRRDGGGTAPRFDPGRDAGCARVSPPARNGDGRARRAPGRAAPFAPPFLFFEPPPFFFPTPGGAAPSVPLSGLRRRPQREGVCPGAGRGAPGAGACERAGDERAARRGPPTPQRAGGPTPPGMILRRFTFEPCLHFYLLKSKFDPFHTPGRPGRPRRAHPGLTKPSNRGFNGFSRGPAGRHAWLTLRQAICYWQINQVPPPHGGAAHGGAQSARTRPDRPGPTGARPAQTPTAPLFCRSDPGSGIADATWRHGGDGARRRRAAGRPSLPGPAAPGAEPGATAEDAPRGPGPPRRPGPFPPPRQRRADRCALFFFRHSRASRSPGRRAGRPGPSPTPPRKASSIECGRGRSRAADGDDDAPPRPRSWDNGATAAQPRLRSARGRGGARGVPPPARPPACANGFPSRLGNGRTGTGLAPGRGDSASPSGPGNPAERARNTCHRDRAAAAGFPFP
ncbi:basic proline-rich protein-like, partial [Zonotrichia leucophrys gambelii]|uniref:basic proline-rich protein-like n=1 Tax=Zonotrichia leucophrys gambelii TaxID=257770 RepID=UPI0031402287